MQKLYCLFTIVGLLTFGCTKNDQPTAEVSPAVGRAGGFYGKTDDAKSVVAAIVPHLKPAANAVRIRAASDASPSTTVSELQNPDDHSSSMTGQPALDPSKVTQVSDDTLPAIDTPIVGVPVPPDPTNAPPVIPIGAQPIADASGVPILFPSDAIMVPSGTDPKTIVALPNNSPPAGLTNQPTATVPN